MSISKTKAVIAGVLGATLMAGTAVAATQNAPTAQEAPKRQHQMRGPLLFADGNKDGVITRAEMLSSIEARFARLDADKDGKITAEERKAARPKRPQRAEGAEQRPEHAGKRMERRGEFRGKGHAMPELTLDAQRSKTLKMFDYIDRNGDGQIDQAERQLLREVMRELGPRHPRGGRGGFAKHHSTPSTAPTPATGS